MSRYSAAPGENGAMSRGTADRLREIGAQIDPAGTAEIYSPLHHDVTMPATTVIRDASYGPDERNVLDVFAAGDPGAATRPVVVFIHGGGFTRGAKTQPGSPFYDNIMRWAAAQGLIGVNINYRLAPAHTWPSGIEDLERLVAWLGTNIGQYGGDPEQIFLWGHSAGAAHVADFVAAQTVRGRPTGLAGAVLTSGFYQLGDEVSMWQAYYGDEVATYAERSSLAGLAASELPLLVNDAELDPEHFRIQARLLVDARAAAGRPVEYVHLQGHSHISETYAVGTEDTTLSGAVLGFIRAITD